MDHEELYRIGLYCKKYMMTLDSHLATIEMLDDLRYALVGAPSEFPNSSFYGDHNMLQSNKSNEQINLGFDNIIMEVCQLSYKDYTISDFKKEYPMFDDCVNIIKEYTTFIENTIGEQKFMKLRKAAKRR